MTQPLVILIADAGAHALADQLAAAVPGCQRLSFVPPVSLTGRDAASYYFTGLAPYLVRPKPLVVTGTWHDLDPGVMLGRGRERMLERLALALGAVIVWRGVGVAPTTVPATSVLGRSSVAQVLEAVEKRRLVNRGPGAGAFRPGKSILLVGDRPNNARHGELKHRLPFVCMHRGGCSLWLADQLEAAGVGEDRLYWINAYDAYGVATDRDFVDVLKPAKIVALGAEAIEWCRPLNRADLLSAPHPAYWKRWHPKEPYPLLPLLEGIS